MQQTTDPLQAGKYVIWHRTEKDDDGNPVEFIRWSPDCKEMLKTGEYVEDIKDAGKSVLQLRREAINRLLRAEGLHQIDEEDSQDDNALVTELRRLRSENKVLRNQVGDTDEPQEPEAADGDPLNGTIEFGKHKGTSWSDLVASNPGYVRKYVIQKGKVEGALLEVLDAATADDVADANVAPKRERQPRNPTS